MTFDRAQMKREAKLSIRETKPHAVLVALVMVVIILILQVLTMSLNGDIAAIRDTYNEIMAAGYTDMESLLADMENGTFQVATGEGAVGFGSILTFAIELMAMVLGVGYSLYALRVSRHIKAGLGDVFDAFGLFFRAIVVTILPNLMVTLWTCVYVVPVSALISLTGSPIWSFVCLPLMIPAIRASYSYRQAVFIQLDNPRLNPMGCIALSKAAMEGHRRELFKLDLSFLGWWVLQVLVPPAYIWVLPYIRVTQAKYYTHVMGEFAAHSGQMPCFDGQQPPESGEGPQE